MPFRELAFAEVSALIDKLAAAATADKDAAVGKARADAQESLDVAVAERAELAAELDDLQKRMTQAAADLDAERRQRVTLGQQAKDAQQQLKDVGEQLKGANQQLKDANQHLKDANQQLKDASQQQKDASQQLKDANQKLKDANQELQDRSRQLKEASNDLNAMRQNHKRLEQERAGAESRAVELERQQAANNIEFAGERNAMRERIAKETLQSLDWLGSAFARMVRGSTGDDVLTGLVEMLATEFARVAFFAVNGNRLEGRHYVGADGNRELSKLAIPLTMASPLTDAVRDGRTVSLTAKDLDEATTKLFGGQPTFVLMLPISVRGTVTSIVYADDAGRSLDVAASQRGTKIAQILVWHAVPLLTKFAIEDESLSDVRDYAASLVAGLESVYAGDTSHKPAESRRRLEQNLEYARQRFMARVSNAPRSAARLLDEQLRAYVAAKPTTPFARDIAAIIDSAPAASTSSKTAKAEAS